MSGYRGDRLTTQLSMDHNVDPVERLPIGDSNVKVSGKMRLLFVSVLQVLPYLVFLI